MKKRFTKLLKGFFGVLFLASGALSVNAQSVISTNPAPYCNLSATNSYGTCYANNNTFTGSYGFALQSVKVHTLYNEVTACYGSGQNDHYRHWSATTALDPGANYVITIYTPEGTGYAMSAGAWIDYNQNNLFDAADYLGGSSASNNNVVGGLKHEFQFTVPCNAKAGSTRLRAICQYSTAVNSGSACSGVNYGEAWDFTITINAGNVLPKAAFVAGDTTFVNYLTKFVNSNQTGYIGHKWDKFANGSIDATTIDYSTSFPAVGVFNMKLLSTNCQGTDSIIKPITVINPTAPPVPDFVASITTIEQYERVTLYDISSNGPTQWQWVVYDSTSSPLFPITYDLTSFERVGGPNYAPIFEMPDLGKFCVKMRAFNGFNGGSWSPWKVKCPYLQVIPLTIYPIGFGPNETQSSYGQIYDHGGPNLNYGNQRGEGSDRLKIQPCGATKINLTITQFKTADASDVLYVHDGQNSLGEPLHPSGGFNKNTVTKLPFTVTATSGSMYLYFESNNSGVDSGFSGYYTSELGAQTPPVAQWTAPLNPGWNRVPVKFVNSSFNELGIPTREWEVYDGFFPTIYYGAEIEHTFFSDGQYDVCLNVQTCTGYSRYCSTIDIVTPSEQTDLDMRASSRRPALGELDSIIAISDKADRWKWTIFPNNYTFQPGSSLNTQIMELKFSKPGAYTFTLRAWNSLDSANTVKTIARDKYVVVLDYCNPTSNLLSADIGINNVKLKRGSDVLLDNTSTSGESYYTNYSSLKMPKVTYGETYSVEVSRSTNVDPATRKVWIDWNIDGDFDDAGELVLNESVSNNFTTSANFTVPDYMTAFQGITRMRVGIGYSSFALSSCGPVPAGEFEDYYINIVNDNKAPEITLIGSDTITIEEGTLTFTDPGATASDPTEGDITSKIVTSTDLELSKVGFYTRTFDVTDASGNKAPTRTRVYVVIKDRTAPILTLNGNIADTVEVFSGPYSDPGYSAFDNVNGNLDLAVNVTGSVNTEMLGTYTLTYRVNDAANNESMATRTVTVVDRQKPVIVSKGSDNIQIGSVWVDLTYVEDNYDKNTVLERTPGYAGEVFSFEKGEYPIHYAATDGSGNVATPVTRVYVVDDFIPPTITLNTMDTVYHDVTLAYSSVSASATDNYYSGTDVQVKRISSNVNPFVLGLYTEVFRATDKSNNVTLKTRYVRVVDRVAPEIWANNVTVHVGVEFNPFEGVFTRDNYYAPGVLMPRVEIVASDLNVYIPGVYSISYRVTDPSGNVSDVLNRVVYVAYGVDNSVSVDDVTLDNIVSVYPNPASSEVRISFTGVVKNDVKIEMFNIVGSVVATMDVATNDLNDGVTINVSDLPEGIYLVKLTSGNQVTTKRIVVTR